MTNLIKNNRKDKRYNYKLVIGFVLGLFLFGGSAYATINYAANMFEFDNSTSTLNSNNLQSAITELASKYTNTMDVSGKLCGKELPSFITSGAVLDNISSTYVSNSNGVQFNAVSSDTNGKGIYIRAETKNDLYPIYYYRGAVTNNNVLFGDFCWKIVRTTETGGIKLIYNGEPSNNQCTNTTGANTRLDSTNKYNSGSSLARVGYMYGTTYSHQNRTVANLGTSYKYGNSFYYDGTNYNLLNTISSTGNWATDYNTLNNNHYTCFDTTGVCSSIYYIYYTDTTYGAYNIEITGGKGIEQVLDEMLLSSTNTTSSVIKTAIDSWYSTNLNSYTSYLEDTAWCSDRSIYNYYGFNPNGGNTTGNLAFSGYGRAHSLYTPRLKCSQNDSFTVSSSNGNGKLTYPIGLLTLDEAMLAGGKYGGNNSTYYLYTNDIFWLMSPDRFSTVLVSRIDASGRINAATIGSNSHGVRPSVSLKAGLVWSGSGTSSNPYTVSLS